MTEEEHQSLVIDFNKSAAPYPSDHTVVDLFEAQVERTPHDVAMRLDARSVTYRELNEHANRIASRLATAGVAPRQFVAIFMEHSIEVVASILAVLKTGAAYVPISVRVPAERLRFILNDIAAAQHGTNPVLLTQSRLQSRVPHGVAGIIAIDGDFAAVAGYPATNAGVETSPHDAAYVIYTSGSTGEPKGVVVEHRSLVNYIWWANEKYCQGERTTWPLFSSLAFDLTVTSIFTPLISGGSLIAYPADPALPGTAMVRVVEDNAVDVVKLTPAHLMMVKEMDLSASRIRRFIVGGEDLKTSLAREVTRKFTHPVEIFNEYGPTEATVGCMIHRYDVEKDVTSSVPIGVPAANAGIFVLDEDLVPVPPGIAGEMHLAGDGLARGYLNLPDLTAKKFVTASDPRTGAPVRMYKTGDLARWADGRMEFLGRADDQVKIGGARIELGEVEARLLDHPQIRECVVHVVNNGNGNANGSSTAALAAYYVTDTVLSVSDLRMHLASVLPPYMLPSYYVRLERLPLTQNGKVDRKALPAFSLNGLLHAGALPRTATEKTLAAIWTELLNLPELGIHDDFFDLGLKSLAAIKAVSRMREVFNVDVPLRNLFERPTVAGLAELIDAQLFVANAKTRPVSSGEREEIAF